VSLQKWHWGHLLLWFVHYEACCGLRAAAAAAFLLLPTIMHVSVTICAEHIRLP